MMKRHKGGNALLMLHDGCLLIRVHYLLPLSLTVFDSDPLHPANQCWLVHITAFPRHMLRAIHGCAPFHTVQRLLSPFVLTYHVNRRLQRDGVRKADSQTDEHS